MSRSIHVNEKWQVMGQRELSATEVSVWGDEYEPDDFKAYVEFEVVKALPKVIGPESHGLYFGYHPAVLARSHSSLVHKATNFNHTMKSHGSYRDRLNGCVVATSFPDSPDGGEWKLPENIEDAPSIKVLAVIWKSAEGVPKMLGEFLGGTVAWSISIEASFGPDDIYIFDPKDRSFTLLGEALSGDMQEAVRYDEVTEGLVIGTYRGHQLAVAPGGEDGTVPFNGVAYTDSPAEDTAVIHRIAASSGMVVGSQVKWVPVMNGGLGRGAVKQIHAEGVFAGKKATEENPVLCIELASGRNIYRTLNGCELVKK